jgi:hypothetical protein
MHEELIKNLEKLDWEQIKKRRTKGTFQFTNGGYYELSGKDTNLIRDIVINYASSIVEQDIKKYCIVKKGSNISLKSPGRILSEESKGIVDGIMKKRINQDFADGDGETSLSGWWNIDYSIVSKIEDKAIKILVEDRLGSGYTVHNFIKDLGVRGYSLGGGSRLIERYHHVPVVASSMLKGKDFGYGIVIFKTARKYAAYVFGYSPSSYASAKSIEIPEAMQTIEEIQNTKADNHIDNDAMEECKIYAATQEI